MNRLMRKAEALWKKVEVPTLFIGIPGVVIVWAYGTFATAVQISDARAEINETKVELRTYVDLRHEEALRVLQEIKEEQRQQRTLQEKILLRLSR